MEDVGLVQVKLFKVQPGARQIPAKGPGHALEEAKGVQCGMLVPCAGLVDMGRSSMHQWTSDGVVGHGRKQEQFVCELQTDVRQCALAEAPIPSVLRVVSCRPDIM